MNFIAIPAILRKLSAKLCLSPDAGLRAEALGLGFIGFEAVTTCTVRAPHTRCGLHFSKAPQPQGLAQPASSQTGIRQDPQAPNETGRLDGGMGHCLALVEKPSEPGKNLDFSFRVCDDGFGCNPSLRRAKFSADIRSRVHEPYASCHSRGPACADALEGSVQLRGSSISVAVGHTGWHPFPDKSLCVVSSM